MNNFEQFEISANEMNNVEGGTFYFGFNFNFCAPKPTYCAPKPTYCAPKPTYCAPKPTYCAPTPTTCTPPKTSCTPPTGCLPSVASAQ